MTTQPAPAAERLRQAFQNLSIDLRLAVRGVTRARTASIMMAGAIAVGLGTAVAGLAIVRVVERTAMPFPGASQLFMVIAQGGGHVAYADHVALSERSVDFRTAAFERLRSGATFYNGQWTEAVDGALATVELPLVLGISPALGRWFQEEDYLAGSEPRVVVSESFWRSNLGERPDIIGTSIALNDTAMTVSGVMPSDFAFPDRAVRFWRPLRAPVDADGGGRGGLSIITRLNEGVGADAARLTANLAVARPVPAGDARTRLELVPRLEYVAGNLRARMLALVMAIVLGLAVVSANTTVMMLSRAASRSVQSAVRHALGAPAAAIARFALLESMIVAVAGGILAVPLALVAVRMGGQGLGLGNEVSSTGFTLGVVAAAALGSLLLGLLCGWPPAIVHMRARLGSAGIGSASSRLASMAQRLLVVVQAATAFTLLVAASGIVRSYAALVATDPGFRTTNIVTVRLELPREPYRSSEPRLAFFESLQQRVRTMPGVTGVSLTSHLLTRVDDQGRDFVVEGHVIEHGSEYSAAGLGVGREYFDLLGMRVVSGRGFLPTDQPQSEPVVLINESAAARFCQGSDPVGTRIRMGRVGSEDPWLRVVGVVRDTDRRGPVAGRRPDIYFLYEQNVEFRSSRMFALASVDEPGRLTAETLRRIVAGLDPRVPVREVTTLATAFDEFFAEPRMVSSLLSASAILAAGLALFGLYTCMLLVVATSARELGIRLALGAATTEVSRGVLVQAARLGAVGVGVGAGVSLLLSRVVNSLVHGTDAANPAWMVPIGIVFVLTLVASAAGPARRAANVDPLRLLRDAV